MATDGGIKDESIEVLMSWATVGDKTYMWGVQKYEDIMQCFLSF